MEKKTTQQRSTEIQCDNRLLKQLYTNKSDNLEEKKPQ